MGSHSVTCHPEDVTFQPLPQPKRVLDLATPEGCKAELSAYHTSDVVESTLQRPRPEIWTRVPLKYVVIIESKSGSSHLV